MRKGILVILLVGLSNVCLASAFSLSQTAIHYFWDGDTFKVFCNEIDFPCKKSKLSVRIANINTPEIDGKCAYEINLARAALSAARRYVYTANDIVVKPNSKRRYDRNKRLLARVYVDGKDLGQLLVNDGLAEIWQGKRSDWCTANEETG